MAKIKVEFFSEALNRPTVFDMFIPNDNREWENGEPCPMRTLFLLHGYTGSAGNWVSEVLLRKHNIAVVMPNGENAFYLDGLSTGHKFCTYTGGELVEYVRKTFGLARSAEDTFIMGMSMGGFGALHTGLAYPEVFGKIGAFSSALIVHGIAGMKEGNDNGVANYYYYRECFGDLDRVEESSNNPEVQISALLKNGQAVPQIYMCCGTEDFLLDNNRQLHSFLSEKGVAHEYFESAGAHDMTFWSEYAPKAIEWMCK